MATEDTTEIVAGATLHYHEGRAEEPERVWEDNPFGSKYVTFRAVVDSVQGDYVELTTTTQPNGHVHAPDFGASMAKSKAVIESDPRWKLARD